MRMTRRAREKSVEDSSLNSSGDLSDVMSNDTKNTDLDYNMVAIATDKEDRCGVVDNGRSQKRVS